jgi:lipopolysaccharide transport system permease protein
VVDFNPMYHLLEVVRRPLLAGEPAGSLSYLVAGLVILTLSVVATALIGFYRRRIVFSL